MILIVYASTGFGHKKAALALQEEFLAQNPKEPCEALDILSLTPQFHSHFYAGMYWFLANHTPSLWSFFYHLLDKKQFHQLLFPLSQIINHPILGDFKDYLIENQPRCLFFTHFLGLYAALELRKSGQISCPIKAVVTDFFAHSFWIYPPVDEFCVMHEDTKKELTSKWGIDEDKIRVTGIPVSRKLTQTTQKKDPAFLKSLGLSKNRLTLLFTSGAFGLGPMVRWLEVLRPLADHIQAIVVCGNNHKLKKLLDQKRFPYPAAIFGFVDNMPELMSVSDLLIAKPGGITMCEALTKAIPIVISSVIPGQEEGNLKMLREHDACWYPESAEKFMVLVKNILDHPDLLEKKSANMVRLAKPYASWEIVHGL